MLDKPTTKHPAEKVLTPHALHNQADYDRAVWFVEVDNDTTLADILRPGYWAHHYEKVRRGSLLEVMSEDGELDVTLRVLDSEIGAVTVRLREGRLREGESEPVADESKASLSEVPEGYKVRFSKPVQYYVTLGNLRIGENYTKAEAVQAAIYHAALAAGEAE